MFHMYFCFHVKLGSQRTGWHLVADQRIWSRQPDSAPTCLVKVGRININYLERISSGRDSALSEVGHPGVRAAEKA